MTKRITFTLGCLMLAVACLSVAQAQTTNSMSDKTYKIAIISDIHLLAPSLFDDGYAAKQMAKNDMKLALESDIIMERIADCLIHDKIDLLIITGDLTHNGTRASHERLAEHLRRLRQCGVKTLVIPGNHDVSNPNARAYLGNESMVSPTITREEFAQLYAASGYGDTACRDPHSLSYVNEPLPGLVVIGMDSNLDEQNRLKMRGDTVDTYHNGGLVKPETLQWVRKQALTAKAEGKHIVALMHHHLLEHIDGEARFLPNYIVSNHNEVLQTLTECDIHVVFTGHLHITDAVALGSITDIATGSASMYPLPLRLAEWKQGCDSLRIDTHFADFELDEQILAKGKQQVTANTTTLAHIIAGRMWARLADKMTQLKQMLVMQGEDTQRFPSSTHQATELMMKHMREPLTQSLLTVTHGGEDPNQADAVIKAIKQGVTGMVAEVMPNQAINMGPFLIENLLPRVEPMLRSALEDKNRVGTAQESSTPDLRLSVKL